MNSRTAVYDGGAAVLLLPFSGDMIKGLSFLFCSWSVASEF
jgi:hypothetical protein